MRRHGGNDQRVARKSRQVAFGEAQRVGGRFVVGYREADDGFAQHAAHPRLFGRFGYHVLEIVHVGERGCAAEQHFQAPKARAPAHEIGRNILGFGGEDELFQPILQPQVIGDAAKQRHGCVCVCVDQARREDGVGAVQAPHARESCIDFGARADGENARAAHRYGAVFDHAMRCVLGDDVTRAPDPVGLFRREREDE